MNVLLINDSSSNPNWGDRAAAIALKRMIRDCGCAICAVLTEDQLRDSAFAEGPVKESSTGPARRSIKDWGRLLLPPVVLKVREKILNRLSRTEHEGPVPLVLEDFERCADVLLQDRSSFGGLLDAIEAADVAVVHGDGCMVGNGILPRSELFLGYLIKTRFHKPVVLINHTADLSHPDLNRMAQAVYPRLDDVTYRDKTSSELCQGRWPGRYAADSAFLFEPATGDDWLRIVSRPTYFDVWPDKAEFDPARPYVCVGGSSIYSFDRGPTEAINGFLELVSHLCQTYSGQIVLMASDGKDQTILRPVASALRLPLVGLTIPVQQAVDIIGNARAYVGGRWHPAIFALRGGTPVVPLSSKTFKMDALIAKAGLPVTIFDALDLHKEKEGIAQALHAVVAQGDELRQRLRCLAAKEAENSWDNVSFLRRWCGLAGGADRSDTGINVRATEDAS